MQMASSFFYLARILYINVTLTLNKDWRESHLKVIYLAMGNDVRKFALLMFV